MNSTNGVYLERFWQSTCERTLDHLQKVYQNRELLLSRIEAVTNAAGLEKQLSGRRVLLKPNWVCQNRPEFPWDSCCLRTNDQLVLAMLEYILRCHPAEVTVGDAPIQGCDWALMGHEIFPKIDELRKKYATTIRMVDFRRTRLNLVTNQKHDNCQSMDHYVIFDLGGRSRLDEVSDDARMPFRITNYDPRRLAKAHRRGVHRYCITREWFDADVVISMPKTKTHQKAGFTNAMKNLVGINGDKDFLPHHRIGGRDRRGDCYPQEKLSLHIAELLLDSGNKHIGTRYMKLCYWLSRQFCRIAHPAPEETMGASWYGNDTIWRTVADLNFIARYGVGDGICMDTPQRVVYSLCDGIIGGQGNGPLHPEPLPLGFIGFSSEPMQLDLVMARLMGLSIDDIPLLRYAQQSVADSLGQTIVGGVPISDAELSTLAISAQMPPGWRKYRSS